MTNVHSLQWHYTQCLKINLYNCLLKADCLKSAISDLGYFLFVKKLFEYIKDVNECSNIRIFVFRSNIRIRFLDSNIHIFYLSPPCASSKFSNEEL